jgi:hypothetical protein
VRPGIKALVTGVAATGQVGPVTDFILWGAVVPNQNPSYVGVVPAASSGYSSVTPNQSPIWSSVVT